MFIRTGSIGAATPISMSRPALAIGFPSALELLGKSWSLRFVVKLSLTAKREVGVPMSPNKRPAWILGVTLFITVATSLAGCAATPLTDSRSAEKPASSQEIESSINPGRPEPDAWHALRGIMVELYD